MEVWDLLLDLDVSIMLIPYILLLCFRGFEILIFHFIEDFLDFVKIEWSPAL